MCPTALVPCVLRVVFRVLSPPQVTKVHEITSWDLLHHRAYVGVTCDNNAEESGLAFTDNAFWMSSTSPADVTMI